MKCLSCGKETNNPRFCSRSCSASYNNKKIGARHGDPDRSICPECGGKKFPASKICHICKKKNEYDETQAKPLKDFLIQHGHPQYNFNRVRKWAKLLMEYRHIKKVCKNCGYSLHVECCHLKPMTEFDLNTPMGIVNGEENLVYLCRNCHWELDNGYLEYPSY